MRKTRVLSSREIACLVAFVLACAGLAAARADEVQRSEMVAEALRTIPDEGDRTLSPYFFVLSDDPEVDRMPLKSTRADVSIAGVIADVQVSQVYRNGGDSVLEAIYIFPMSTRAAVHAMTMTVGERVIDAEIREKEQAQQEYDDAISEGRTASLLQQHRPNVFQMSVGNILPGDEIVVELSYVELLVPEDGVYEFVYPTVVGPRYSNDRASDVPATEQWVENPYLREGTAAFHTFGADIWLNSGIQLARTSSPSHDVAVEFIDCNQAHLHVAPSTDAGNRDLVFRYSLLGDDIESGVLVYEGEEESFFLLMVEPPERVSDADVVPREYVFILDVSGSMHGFPLDTSKALMEELLAGLRPTDWFNVMVFAGSSGLLSEESLVATDENIDWALDQIHQLRGGGGTELLPALEKALALPRTTGTSRIVVIATDGYVSVEQQTFQLIAESLGEANMFPFGIGSSVNRHLIEGMAHAGMGEPFVVLSDEEAGDKAATFAEYIASPVLQGIQVDPFGVEIYDVEPVSVPDLFARRPVVVFGKIGGATEGEIVVSGSVPWGTFEKVIDLEDAIVSDDNEALRYLWARHRIRRLSDLNTVGHDEARVEEVTRLGLEYNLMTQYTSFAAVDTVVRADGADVETVEQPLPLPQGVSNYAVGGNTSCKSAVIGGVVGSQVGTVHGLGGLGTRGRGTGGGGFGAGASAGSGTGSGTFGRKSVSAPSAVSGDPIILGALDKSVIDRVVKQHLAQMRYCYQKELNKDPTLAGKVVIKFTIESDGTVSVAEVKSSTLGNETVENCLCQRFLRLQFPAPSGSGTVIVSYPFVFQSGE